MRLFEKYLISDDKEGGKWSGDVSTKWHPPEDLFATGSAEEIATTLSQESKDLGQAMSRLMFYVNRAGSNLSSARKSVMTRAEELLRAKFKGSKEE
jgi:hypothetical protein